MVKKKKEPEKPEIKPYPSAGDNKDFVNATQKIRAKTNEDVSGKTKRHRRTKAEIDAERYQVMIDETGFETFRDFMKMLSDNDAKRYGLDKVPKEHFEPLAKQYAIISNYFLPKGKPIYFVCVSAGIQSFMMLKTRKELIDKKMIEKGEKAGAHPSGKEAGGFPSLKEACNKEKV